LSGTEDPRVLLRKQGMFVLDAIKDHLTLEVRSVTQPLNTDLVQDDFIYTFSKSVFH
jgi:hypothetical protein